MSVRWEAAALEASLDAKLETALDTVEGQGASLGRVAIAARSGSALRNALLSLCDTRDDPGLATVNARSNALAVMEDFYRHPPRRDDPERVLAGAVAQALFSAYYYPAGDGSSAAPGGATAPDGTAAPGGELAVVAAAVERGILYVAQSAGHQIYLWRAGELTPLTVDAPAPLAVGHARHPLARGDRVLLCSEAFTRRVAGERIAEVLSSQREPGGAVAALLGMAAEATPGAGEAPAPVARPQGSVSVAVLNYDPALAGPAASVLAGVAAVAVLGALVVGGSGLIGLLIAGGSRAGAPAPPQPPAFTPVHAVGASPTGAPSITGALAVTVAQAVAVVPAGAGDSAMPTVTLRATLRATLKVTVRSASSPPATPATPASTAAPATFIPAPAATPGTAPSSTPLPSPTGVASPTPVPPTPTGTPVAEQMPLAPAVQALHPVWVIPGAAGAPITATAIITPQAPAAYILYVRQGQTLSASLSQPASVSILNAQGQALFSASNRVYLKAAASDDYVVVVSGTGQVVVTVTVK